MDLKDLVGTGKQLLRQVKQRARTLEEDLKARREVEIEGMAAGVRARLAGQIALSALPVDPDLRHKRGPAGVGQVHTEAFSSESLRKVVLSQISMSPIIEGFALVLIPRPTLDFPIFAADLMALPTRVSVNADTYGSEWQNRSSLSSVRAVFRGLGSGPGPLWAQRLGSGCGLHARLSPRRVEEGFAALSQALAAYLDELKDAPPGRSDKGQAHFFEAFHANGPRKGPISKILGKEWTERYSRLMFE